MEQADVLIAGGGMSGLVAAISAARNGNHPIILEKMDRPGRKLLATGNGRCNLLHRGPPVYYGDSRFAEAVLGKDPAENLSSFWHSLGILIRYDAEGRGYPMTFSSATVLDALLSEIRRLNIVIRTNQTVEKVTPVSNGFRISTHSGFCAEASRLILSTGGAAQEKLGGNMSAWSWLRKIGHSMILPSPSLTPLITDKKSISGLSGIRVKCRVTLFTRGNPVHRETGELLFTDHGISGICVMQCSRFVLDGCSECRIDLVSDLFDDRESLIKELSARRKAFSGEEAAGLLKGICLPRLAYAVCKQSGLALQGEKAGDLTDKQIHDIASVLLSYRIQIQGREGFERAQVMAGGLNCEEVRRDNMESMLCPGLHVTGELLNVDGDCGGYNLMFATMTGIRAGQNRRNSLNDQR